MLIKSAFCQSLIENSLQDLKDIKFALWGDNRPTDEELSKHEINIYWHSEPEEYFGNHSWIYNNWQKFAAVLTWSPRDISNAIFCPFGTSPYIDHPEYMSIIPYAKDPAISFIRGDKHFNVPGHHLRWELWERRNEIKNQKFFERTTPAYASNPQEEIEWFRQRTEIFGDNMFHIAIENTSHEGYFTEKIIDCFIFKTVPIYYGCPNIKDFFDPAGIITFNSINELVDICNNLTMEDYYKRLTRILHNQKEAHKYLHLGKTIHEKLETLFKFNGLL